MDNTSLVLVEHGYSLRRMLHRRIYVDWIGMGMEISRKGFAKNTFVANKVLIIKIDWPPDISFNMYSGDEAVGGYIIKV